MEKVRFLRATSAYGYFAGDIGYVKPDDIEWLLSEGIVERLEDETKSEETKAETTKAVSDGVKEVLSKDWMRTAHLIMTAALLGVSITILIILI